MLIYSPVFLFEAFAEYPPLTTVLDCMKQSAIDSVIKYYRYNGQIQKCINSIRRNYRNYRRVSQIIFYYYYHKMGFNTKKNLSPIFSTQPSWELFQINMLSTVHKEALTMFLQDLVSMWTYIYSSLQNSPPPNINCIKNNVFISKSGLFVAILERTAKSSHYKNEDRSLSSLDNDSSSGKRDN